MNLPNLDLEKHRSIRYVVDGYAQTTKSNLRALAKADVLDDFVEDTPNIVWRNYTRNQKKHSVVFLFTTLKKSKTKTTLYYRVEYRRATLDSRNLKKKSLDFGAFCAFLRNRAVDHQGMAVVTFSYPLKQYALLLNLPYYGTEVAIGKKIQIYGLDLEMETDGEKYRQYLRADDSDIFQRIGLEDFSEPLSRKLIESKIVLASTYARAMVKKKRASQNG